MLAVVQEQNTNIFLGVMTLVLWYASNSSCFLWPWLCVRLGGSNQREIFKLCCTLPRASSILPLMYMNCQYFQQRLFPPLILVVVNWEWFCSLGDIGQYLETFLIVVTGLLGEDRHLCGKAADPDKCHTMQRTATSPPPHVITVEVLRNPDWYSSSYLLLSTQGHCASSFSFSLL